MAGETIDASLVTQFSDQVHVAAQQMKSNLRDAVIVKPMSGDIFAYDGLSSVEAVEMSGRHQPVTFSDIVHSRRKITRRRFTLALPIDASDVRGALVDPQSEYARACASAMERVFDRVVVDAMFAAVLTGRDMGTSVTFANDDGDTINATAGLTYAKLVEMTRLFLDDDIGTASPERMILGISGDEHEDLMQEQELVSGDFSRQYAIDKGRMIQAAGYELKHFAGAATLPILAVSGGTRDCFAMTPRAMCVGMSKEMSVKIEPRPDLTETVQVVIVFDLGAVRTEGKQIKKVQTTD